MLQEGHTPRKPQETAHNQDPQGDKIPQKQPQTEASLAF